MIVNGGQERVQLQFAGADDFDISTLTREILKNSEGSSVQLVDLVTISMVRLGWVLRAFNLWASSVYI